MSKITGRREQAIRSAKHTAHKALTCSEREGKEQIARTAISLASAIDREAANIGLVNKPDLEALINAVTVNMVLGKPLPVFAPSCPDYKHNGSMYTFGGIGSSISLLGMYQIEFAEKLLPILDIHGVPYAYVVLTADIEIEDDVMLKLNGVTKEEAAEKVKGTIAATGEYLSLLSPQNGSTSRSVGFLEEFPDFRTLQAIYESHIAEMQQTSDAFRRHLQKVHEGRFGLYKRLFPGMSEAEMHRLMPRTIRTMAQYAALGGIARERNAVIASHCTLNIPAYNDGRLFLGQSSARVPVLNFDRRIY